MANLTVTIDEDVLREARIRALREGTSVNAVVRERLSAYASRDRTAENGVSRFLDGADKSSIGSSDGGRNWVREDLHER